MGNYAIKDFPAPATILVGIKRDKRIPGQKRTGEPLPFRQRLNGTESRNHFPVPGTRFSWRSQCLFQPMSAPPESQLSTFSLASSLSCSSNWEVIFAVKNPIDFTYALVAPVTFAFAAVKSGLIKRFLRVS